METPSEITEEEEELSTPHKTTKWRKRFWKYIKGKLLILALLIAMASAVGVGFLLRYRSWTKREVMYVRFVGVLFLQSLLCVVLPLTISSIIAAVGTIEISLSCRIGFYSLVYFLLTSLVAVALGVLLVITISPGLYIKGNDFEKFQRPTNTTPVDDFMDYFRNLIPPNIVEASIFQYGTNLVAPTAKKKYIEITNSSLEKYGNKTLEIVNTPTGKKMMIVLQEDAPPFEEWIITFETVRQTNYLGISFCSMIFGLAVSWMREDARPLLNVLVSLNEVMMCITYYLILFSPVGIFFLLVAKVIQIQSIVHFIHVMGIYITTVIAGLVIHSVLILSFMLCLSTAAWPFKFLRVISQALITAFATASSTATLPIAISNVEDFKVDPRVADFVLPLGSVFNRNGSALCDVVAAIFVAQFRKIEITKERVLVICSVATAASVGGSGVPFGDLGTTIMIFNAVGLPLEDIGLILEAEWLLGRFRAAVNVYCNCIGAVIVDKMCRRYFDKSDFEDKPLRPK